MTKPHPLTRRSRGLALVLLFAILSCQPMSPSSRRADPSRPAHISFLTVPDGASVRINGRVLVGTTPLEYEAVEPGLSVIELQLEGYQPVRLQRYWESGASERVDVVLIPLATPTPILQATATPTPSQTIPLTPLPIEPTTSPPARTRAPTTAPTAAVRRGAKVSFRSRPSGATVIVDGRRLPGTTPLKGIDLPAGKATIVFELENHEPETIERTWTGGADTVTAELKGLPARVSFISTPPGASVKVNDVIVEGQTPIDAALVPAGKSHVLFELENYISHSSEATWKPAGEARVEAVLVPIDARVRFESDPPGATVTVNGTELDAKTPLGPLPMAPQRARVEFRLEGHDTLVIEREWAPNTSDTILANLAANPGRVRFESPSAWDSMEIDGETVVVRPGGWLSLAAGPHRVLAARGPLAAETDFEVPPGGDVVVALDWTRKRPNPTEYVELPAVRVTLGSKQLADSSSVRTVDVPAFWIGRREVTVDQYRQCVEAQRCEAPGTTSGCNWQVPDRGAHPVNCVGIKDAEAYAAWFAEAQGLPYRLPTADEWERAARGGGTTYPWGDDPPGSRCNTCDRSCAQEQFRDDAANDGWPTTSPAGAMAYCVSAEGVLDLVGNVAEWCHPAEHGGRSQVRGGSWAQNGIFLDPALGVNRPPTDRDPTVGFRLAVSPDAAGETKPQATPVPSEPTPAPASPPTDIPAIDP
jgi:formylglycine-generating enzyme required for sulfatase activity